MWNGVVFNGEHHYVDHIYYMIHIRPFGLSVLRPYLHMLGSSSLTRVFHVCKFGLHQFIDGSLELAHFVSTDTSILHHAFISIFIALWAVITHYVTILMPILSYFTRITWRGRMPAARILGWKGENIRYLFSIAPKVLKLHGSHFWN